METFSTSLESSVEGTGSFNYPCCLSMNKSRRLMVCDSGNNRFHIFQVNGKFVGKFGTEGSNLGEFNSPVFVTVLSNGRIVVCDEGNDPWYPDTGVNIVLYKQKTPVIIGSFYKRIHNEFSVCVIC